MRLDELHDQIRDCTQCRLCESRTQVVFGGGAPDSDVVFVGEAPGLNEDKQGVPFVGRAGQLLNRLLGDIGLSREEVYIANVIKCRPPNNRDPQPDEVSTCKPFLFRQLEIITPRIVCTLGNFATRTLLGRQVSISKVRGRAFRQTDYVVFPIYHPAAALHQGSLLDPLMTDFRALGELLDELRAGPAESAQSVEDAPPSQEQLDLF